MRLPGKSRRNGPFPVVGEQDTSGDRNSRPSGPLFRPAGGFPLRIPPAGFSFVLLQSVRAGAR